MASYACTQPTAASLRPSLEVPTQGLSVTRFKDAEGEPVNAKHQCGYCENRVHCYCDLSASRMDGEPSYAICNPNTGRACFAKHVSKVAPTHTAQFHGPRQPTHTMIRESPLRQRARTGANAPAPASGNAVPRRL